MTSILFPQGTRVQVFKHGLGTVEVERDLATDPYTKQKTATGRVGVVLDDHKLLAKPAFFWPGELTKVQP